MKRQGGNIGGRKEEKKKCKMEAAKEEGGSEGWKKNRGEVAAAAAATAEEINLVGWEELLGLRGGVLDEEMSWGLVWSPYWDVHFVDKAYGALFNDVAWDDDIWNLKTINQIPKP